MIQQGKLKMKSKTRKVQKISVSAFISKTYEFLEERKYPDIVDWNPEGTAIVIKSPVEFAQQVLNVYFKHKNLTSFVRQLNMYGFHKQRTHKVEYVYSHELFQRDKKHLLDQIKRKNQEQISIDSSEATEETESEPCSPNISALLQEKQALKRYNIQAFDKINCLEGKVKDLTLQNQNLQEQLSQQTERDKILISLMANILQKYGIPPTELSNVMKEGLSTPYYQSLASLESHISRVSSNSTEASLSSYESNSDINNYLDLSSDNVALKNANVLPSIPNTNSIHDKGYNRDVAYGRPSRIVNEPQWDNGMNHKVIVPCCPHREGTYYKPSYIQEKEPMFRECPPNMNAPCYQEGNLKRKFEEANHPYNGEDTFEVIKKKMETTPLFNRANDFYNNNGIFDAGIMKGYAEEVPFYNFKQVPWI